MRIQTQDFAYGLINFDPFKYLPFSMAAVGTLIFACALWMQPDQAGNIELVTQENTLHRLGIDEDDRTVQTQQKAEENTEAPRTDAEQAGSQNGEDIEAVDDEVQKERTLTGDESKKLKEIEEKLENLSVNQAAIDLLEMTRGREDPDIQLALAELYNDPNYKDYNPDKALDFYRSAFQAGAEGTEGPIRKLAEEGYPEAQYLLSQILFSRGDLHREEALEWLEKGAEGKCLDATFVFGSLLEEGDQVPKDLERARHFYHIGAVAYRADSSFRLGLWYLHYDASNEALDLASYWFSQVILGVKTTPTMAELEGSELHLRKLAIEGVAAAQMELGFLLMSRRLEPRGDETAIYWLQKAKDQGHSGARCLLESEGFGCFDIG